MVALLSHRDFLCPVVIGRTAECAELRAFLGGAGGVLLVSGEAGIGKTRLVREACGLAEASGIRVLEGRCFEADRTLPFAPVLDLLRVLIASRGAAEVAALAGSDAADLARLCPELAPGTGVAEELLEPELGKRRLFAAFGRLLSAVAGGDPLLVLIEDLHWSDDGSLDLLLDLARRATRERRFILLTYRGDEIHPALAHFLAALDRERLAAEVALASLDPQQVAAMLQAIFRSERPVPAELLHTLYSLTEGNPFFLEEVLTALGADGTIVPGAGCWPERTLDAVRVPRSVHDAVRQRLARLSEAARGVLTLAAVAGRHFDFDLLRELTGHDEETLLALMKELVAAHLVVEEAGDRFAFRHALTREAIAAGLLDRERRLRHRGIATALIRLHADAPDTALDDLAVHWFAAGCWREAGEAARLAGLRAATLHAPRAAAAHFTRAIEAARALGLPAAAELYRERGRAYETLGEFESARDDLETALALARARDDRREEWRALLALGLLWASRDYEQTGHLVTEAVAVARELGDPAALARSLNRLGNWRLNVEQPREAIALHHEALAILEPLADEQAIAETLDLLGMASVMGADGESAAAPYRRAISLWRRRGDRRGLAASLIGGVLGAHTFHTDTVPAVLTMDDAAAMGEEGLALARALGWRAGESFALWGFRGMALGAAGQYDLALSATRLAVSIAEEIGHQQWLTGARCMLGVLHGELGDFPTAGRELAAASALAQEIGSPYWRRSAAGWLASALVRADDRAGAAALLAAELSDDTPLDTIAGRLLWTAAAELALAQGAWEEVLALVARLLSALPGTSARPVPRLVRVRGPALARLGRLDEAEKALRDAREAAVWSGARPLLWRIDAALGRVASARQDAETAERAFAAARATAAEMSRTIPDDALRASFLQLVEREVPPVPRGEADASATMTKRELEVAALLTAGLTNREIGERLFLSEWTVATHVRNILAKLALSSRVQIAAWAAQRGLANGS